MRSIRIGRQTRQDTQIDIKLYTKNKLMSAEQLNVDKPKNTKKEKHKSVNVSL